MQNEKVINDYLFKIDKHVKKILEVKCIDTYYKIIYFGKYKKIKNAFIDKNKLDNLLRKSKIEKLKICTP